MAQLCCRAKREGGRERAAVEEKVVHKTQQQQRAARTSRPTHAASDEFTNALLRRSLSTHRGAAGWCNKNCVISCVNYI